jgi:hypothetical protein
MRESKDSIYPDERVWYDQFTSTDWVHDSIADAYRVKALRARKDIRGRIKAFFDGTQGWILSALVGFLTAVVAYVVDVSEAPVFDWKDGYCQNGFLLSEKVCSTSLSPLFQFAVVQELPTCLSATLLCSEPLTWLTPVYPPVPRLNFKLYHFAIAMLQVSAQTNKTPSDAAAMEVVAKPGSHGRISSKFHMSVRTWSNTASSYVWYWCSRSSLAF